MVARQRLKSRPPENKGTGKDGAGSEAPGPLHDLDQGGVPVRRAGRDRHATEGQLEAAALRLVARDGILGGLNLREVATEAGQNRALVYQYFGSRRALLRSALRGIRLNHLSLLRAIRSLPFVQRRRMLFRAAIEDPVYARVEALLALDGDEELRVFPYLGDAMRELERDRENGDLDPALALAGVHAVTLAAQLGYCIFRDNFVSELGVPKDALNEQAEAAFVRMLEGLRPRPGGEGRGSD